MKKYVLYCIYAVVCAYFVYVIIDNIFFPPSLSTPVFEHEEINNIVENTVNETDDGVIFSYSDGVIYLDFTKFDELISTISKNINYDSNLKKIYEDIVDLYYKNKVVKMYSENSFKVLEIKYTKENAIKLFGDYIDFSNDDQKNILLKVYFDKVKYDNGLDVDKIDLKINRETIIRNNIVKLAQAQLGNTGEKYWNWYGFNRRVEWCAVFVSWLAHENGVLNTKIPKFIWVKKGVDFFKERNQLKFPKEYVPKGGDVIFFDWNDNLVIDHVGIVEKVEDGYVYSIEGNVKYIDVERRKTKLNNHIIYAYGVPEY